MAAGPPRPLQLWPPLLQLLPAPLSPAAEGGQRLPGRAALLLHGLHGCAATLPLNSTDPRSLAGSGRGNQSE